MWILKQTVATTLLIGPFIDDTDGKTAETGLTLTQTHVRLSKNGQNMAAKNDAAALVHDELGYYRCSLDTTDTGTLGRLKLMVHQSGALPVWHDAEVVTTNVWDSLFSTDKLQVDTNQISVSGVGLSSIPWNAAWDAEVQSEVQDVVGAAGVGLSNMPWNAAWDAEVESEVEDAVGADVTAVLADTAQIGAGGIGLSAIPWNAAWDAQVESEVNDALVATNLDDLGDRVTLTGTANAGDTTVKITLTGGVATDGYYNGQLVVITGGTGIGQARTILNYLAAGTAATPTRDWLVAPDGSSTFVVIADDVPAILEAGVATAGAAGTITLDATASTTQDLYKNNFIMITGGTGAGQTRLISAYSTGRVASVVPDWTTNPDTTSIYQVLPMGRVDIQGWLGNGVTGDGDWAALKADTAATLVDTAQIGAAGIGLSAVPWNASWDAEVESEARDAATWAITKNTALTAFPFLMVNSSDHATPKTSLTLSGYVSIDGGAFSAVTGTLSEISNGIYNFDAAAADTNGDLIVWRFNASGADDTFFSFRTKV